MRVLLINPTVNHEIRGPHPLKAEDMAIVPHLGLMYIATVLKQNDEFEVKLLDMPLERSRLEDLVNTFRALRPSVIGITVYTDCLYDVKLIIEALRKESKEVTICLGGAHVEVYPVETLRLFPIDCIIRGDGEYSFRELCRSIRDKRDWKDIGGIGYIRNGEAVLNKPWQIDSLDELPFPMRDLSSMHRVGSAVARGESITSICSSRGCPFPCTFCNSPYKKYRLRSVENVIAEIIDCYERYKIKEFFFYDDLFNLTKERLLEVCNAISHLPFSVKWSFRGRINTMDEEVIQRCKDAGCNRIHFGVESGTDRIQKILKKFLNLDDVKKIFDICHRNGIETVANFMIGAPTETLEEIKETLRFARSLNPTFAELHVLVPYPYTEIYKNMLNKGMLTKDVWMEYVENPSPGFKPPLSNGTLTADELYDLLNKAYRNLYFRPSFVFRHLLKLESFKDLHKKIRGACRLFVVTRK